MIEESEIVELLIRSLTDILAKESTTFAILATLVYSSRTNDLQFLKQSRTKGTITMHSADICIYIVQPWLRIKPLEFGFRRMLSGIEESNLEFNRVLENDSQAAISHDQF
ncbi:hypothetical protein V6N13_025925 [Hibiscus sabdariffa]